MDINQLKKSLLNGDPDFWPQLVSLTRQARDFDELFLLSSLRRKAHARKPPQSRPEKIRLAMLGGYSLYPLHELIEHTGQYLSDARRRELQATITDMDAYLESLLMEAVISEFTAVDVARFSQLINKSNQFNLTTRRRSEAEVTAVMNDPQHVGYSVRLKDRFGDHGLISIVIGRKNGPALHIDTWIMSCRVLKRQVEEEVLNELARLAKERGCARLEGLYLPTPKNDMVRDFYSRMGFALTREDDKSREFEMNLENFQTIPTKIKITRRAYQA